MKTACNPPPLTIKTVESFNCFGGGLFDKLYAPFGKVLPESICCLHISGLPFTDDEYLWIGVESILNIFDFNGVTAFTPPFGHQSALNNFDVTVAGLTVGDNPAE